MYQTCNYNLNYKITAYQSRRTGRGQESTGIPPNLLPCQYCQQQPAKLTTLKVQDAVGSSEIPLRTRSYMQKYQIHKQVQQMLAKLCSVVPVSHNDTYIPDSNSSP